MSQSLNYALWYCINCRKAGYYEQCAPAKNVPRCCVCCIVSTLYSLCFVSPHLYLTNCGFLLSPHQYVWILSIWFRPRKEIIRVPQKFKIRCSERGIILWVTWVRVSAWTFWPLFLLVWNLHFQWCHFIPKRFEIYFFNYNYTSYSSINQWITYILELWKAWIFKNWFTCSYFLPLFFRNNMHMPFLCPITFFCYKKTLLYLIIVNGLQPILFSY